MAQPNNTQLRCNEANILLAISAIDRRQIGSVRQAAAIYDVPKTTLTNQLAGKPSRRDCQPNSQKVTPIEEEVIVARIPDLDSQGYPPSLNNVRYMANKLLAKRGAQPVGMRWPQNFVKRTERLTTHSVDYTTRRKPCVRIL